jgi:hypothetical protein
MFIRLEPEMIIKKFFFEKKNLIQHFRVCSLFLKGTPFNYCTLFTILHVNALA